MKKHIVRVAVLAGSASALALSAMPALAQDASPSAGGAANANEIVVTAERRESVLSRVPVSISVLQGRQLDKSATPGISEILSRVPGVRINPNPYGGTEITIRGVAAGDTAYVGSSPTAFYLDGIPFYFIRDAVTPDAAAYDLDRVEVLRGPQGVLYGAAALSGVVRVLAKEPDLNDFDFKGRASASTTKAGSESYRGDLAVNIPLIKEKLALRAVVGYQDIGGWIDTPSQKDVNDNAISTIRLKLAAQPTERLNITASLWHEVNNADGRAASTSRYLHNIPAGSQEYRSADIDAYSGKVSYQFPAFDFTSTTGYLKYAAEGEANINPAGTLPIYNSVSAKNFSQEVSLVSTSEGDWRWSLGAIHISTKNQSQALATWLPSQLDESNKGNSNAVFGQVTRLLMDQQLEISAGLRYFWDKVHFSSLKYSSAAPTPLPGPSAKFKFNALTPRFVITWHPQERSSIYASYSEGFRSGFSQNSTVLAVAPSIPPVKPDSLQNFEIGMKGGIGSIIRYDVSAYYMIWKDSQRSLSVEFPIIGGGTAFTLANVNAGKSSGLGIDAAITIFPVAGMTIDLNASYNGLESDELVTSGGRPLFEKGQRLPGSPEWTAGASVQYDFPIGNGFNGGVGGGISYSSKINDAQPGLPRPVIRNTSGVTSVNGRLSIETPGNWEFSLFGENLTNSRDFYRFGFIPFGSENYHLRPRTVGIQAEYRFR